MIRNVIQAIEASLKRGNDAEVRQLRSYSPQRGHQNTALHGLSRSKGNRSQRLGFPGSWLFILKKEEAMIPEFSQNFKEGDAPLPKEAMDAVTAAWGYNDKAIRSRPRGRFLGTSWPTAFSMRWFWDRF